MEPGVRFSFSDDLHCIRAPPRRGRYWEIHPRRPKDFPRPERFPEGEARGKSRGSREIWRAEGMDFPIPPEFWWSTDNLSASIFLQGVDQKILPCGQGRIDSVKINPSLLMMTDCLMVPNQSALTLIGLTSRKEGWSKTLRRRAIKPSMSGPQHWEPNLVFSQPLAVKVA